MKRILFSIGLALLGQMLLAQSSALTIPEVFYPDGDDPGNHFLIGGLDQYPENKLTVYSRWGLEVYSASPYRNDWDGTTVPAPAKGKRKSQHMPLAPEPLPAGTYYFVLETAQAEPGIVKGFLTIIR